MFIMNKSLIICLFILGLLTLTACSHTSSNSTTGNANIASNDNGAASGNNVQPAANGNDVQKISDIQKAENVGKTVTVQGKVINTLQSARFGISGYKIQDSTGTMIDVSSKKIPKINDTITVTGTLMQTRFFGLVINETG